MKLVLLMLFILSSLSLNAMEKSIYYGFDSDKLTLAKQETLSQLFSNYDNEKLYLHGYADSTGPESYNKSLSKRRAVTIKSYLINMLRVPEANIAVISHGETNSQQSLHLNRRVDISYSNRAVLHRSLANTYGTDDTPAENSYSPMDDANYNVHFITDKDYLTRQEMEAIRIKFSAYSGGDVKLYGYADPRGTANYNLDLSLRRARAVYKYMTTYLGIQKGNVKYYYLGEDGTEGRDLSKKRRVSIYWDTPNYKQPLATIKETYLEPQTDPAEPIIVPEVVAIKETMPVLEEPIKKLEQPYIEEPIIEASIKEEPSDFNDKFWVALFLGLQHSSAYYEGDLPFEHGKNTFLNFGLRAGYHFKPKWHVEGYAYYLPTEVDEHISQVNFQDSKIISYENNLYGINIERDFKNKEKYRWGAQVGYSSHIIGSIEGLGTDPSIPASTYGFNKFNHHGINLGLYYDRYLSEKWKINTEATYILPLQIDDVSDSEPGLWWQAGVGLMRWHKDSRKWQYGVDYRVYYHQSELTFDSNQFTDAEYFIQTLMLGLKRTF